MIIIGNVFGCALVSVGADNTRNRFRLTFSPATSSSPFPDFTPIFFYRNATAVLVNDFYSADTRGKKTAAPNPAKDDVKIWYSLWSIRACNKEIVMIFFVALVRKLHRFHQSTFELRTLSYRVENVALIVSEWVSVCMTNLTISCWHVFHGATFYEFQMLEKFERESHNACTILGP